MFKFHWISEVILNPDLDGIGLLERVTCSESAHEVVSGEVHEYTGHHVYPNEYIVIGQVADGSLGKIRIVCRREQIPRHIGWKRAQEG